MEKDKISLFTAILMNINIMVGAGIFLQPALMAQRASTSSFFGWPVVGIIFFPVVLSIAKVTDFFPGISSFYNYSKLGINQTAGIISGWTYFLGYTSTSALLTVGLLEVLSSQLQLTFIAEHRIFSIFLAVLGYCLLNLLNMSYIGKIQNTLTIFKLLPIVFVILVIFFYWNPHLSLTASSIKQVLYTVPLALFGFWGFEASCNISHLIEGDKKNASKAVMIGFFIAVSIYTLFHLGLMHIMNAENLALYKVPGFVSFLNIKNEIFLKLLSGILSAAFITAFFSSAFGCVLANSSSLFSMADDHLFPFASAIKKLTKNGRPVYCVLLTGLTLFVLLSIISSKEVFTAMSNLGILTSLVLTLISLLLIQIKKRFLPQTFITSLALLSCGILITYSIILIGNDWASRFIYSLPLLMGTGIGFLLFKLRNKI